jgi:hypothetical protein
MARTVTKHSEDGHAINSVLLEHEKPVADLHP